MSARETSRRNSLVARLRGLFLVFAAAAGIAGAARAQPTQLNIEIDSMVLAGPGGHSHQPQAAEIAAIVQMFACHNITLNIVVDDALLPRGYHVPAQADR